MDDRTYTIPLRKSFLKTPRYNRANKAVKAVRGFLQRHTKTLDVRLGEELNKSLWARGKSSPPHHVTVTAKKDGEVIYAELAGTDFKKKEFAVEEEKPKNKLEELKERVAGKKAEPKAEAKAEEPKPAAKEEPKADKPAAKPAAKKKAAAKKAK